MYPSKVHKYLRDDQMSLIPEGEYQWAEHDVC